MKPALPPWKALSDHDRGQALMHMWQRRFASPRTAERHYAPRYRHPDLADLPDGTACAHARTLAADLAALPDPEWDRLYRLADQAQTS